MRIFFLFLVLSAAAIEKNQVLKVEHGQMRVVYSLVNNHHYLKVLQKTNTKVGKQQIYKQMQKLDLQLKDGEYLSIDKNFECHDKNKNYAYGVVTAKSAREKYPFPPLRAWSVNEKDFKLEKVVNPYTIQCEFKKAGKKDYPFPPE